jgi:hypothetical protein
MKAYVMRHDGIVEADVPDGALLLEIGSALNPAGGADLSPIVEIDYIHRRFRRQGGDADLDRFEPFPAVTVEFKDIAWSPARKP